MCVYTKSAHTQVFSGVFARIFTRRKCCRVRHRAAASAVGGLCRGLREWEVSVLLHCHFTSLCRHKDKQVSNSFQGFRGICCSVFSHWRSIYSRNDIQAPYSQPFTEPVSLLLFLPGTTRNSRLCLAVPPPVLTRTCARAYPYPRPRLPVPPPALTRTPPKMSTTPAQAIGVSRSSSTKAEPTRVNTGFR